MHSRSIVLAAWILIASAQCARGDSVVVFNEISYHPAGDAEALEWIELHNQMAVDVDISGWSIVDGVDLAFDEGTVISGGGYLVVARSPAAVEDATSFDGALGPWVGRLENGGERLELRDRNFRLMDRVTFDDSRAWPVAPDGSGHTLAKLDPLSASRPAANWRPSDQLLGTPGAENFPGGLPAERPSVWFSESLLLEAAEGIERQAWVELEYGGEAPLPIGSWTLTSSRPGASSHVFATETLSPGTRRVFTESELGFDLQVGDRLFLGSTDANTIVAAMRLAAGSRARAGRETPWWTPTAPSPAEPASFDLRDEVVISEIQYHPRPTLSRSEVTEESELLPIDAEWRFDDSGAELGSAWREVDFDDSTWRSGPALFFHENATLPAPKRTPLEIGPTTYWFRTTFQFNGDAETARLFVRTVLDDGALFWLNGVEAARRHLPDGPIDASTLATRSIGNARLEGPFEISAEGLLEGENVLAVEVHQVSESSDDVVFGAELMAVRTIRPAADYAESTNEWVELYNRSERNVDLSGWRFDNGIRFAFEPGTTLGSEERIVVARDRDRLASEFPEARIVGNFTGVLSNRSDRLSLVDGIGNPVDEVRYYDRGAWPRWADGLGSSLELRDPFADSSSAESWAASDESPAAEWRSYSHSAVAATDFGPSQWSEFVFGLFDRGEVLLDDFSVLEMPGTASERELLQNGDFERGETSWRFLGTHRHARVEPDPDDASNRILRLVTTGGTEHMHNHVETTLAGGARVINGREYRVSFRAKWVAGSAQLNTRLWFNRLARTHVLDTPTRSGTPGSRNSREVDNIGPSFTELSHTPIAPAVGESVLVSVRASDPHRIVQVTLRWSDDLRLWQGTAMSLDDDGFWRGTIPWQNGRRTAFYVEGVDARGGLSIFPANGQQGSAVFAPADDRALGRRLPVLRIVLASPVESLLYSVTNVMSNEHLPATLVIDESRALYDIGVRLRGSQRGRPHAIRVSFNLRFQPDQLFRGVHRSISTDRSGGWSSHAPTGSQDEIICKHIANHAGGIPSMYDDLAYVIAPRDAHTSRSLLLMARFTGDYLDSQYPNGSDGTKFTYELIYYPTTTADGTNEGLKRPSPDQVLGVDHRDLGEDKELYRWFYLIENNVQRDDYDAVINFAKTLGMSDGAAALAAPEVLDIDQMARAFAYYSLLGVADTYMSGNLHNNIYWVRPSDRRVLVFPWDMDFAWFNSTSHPAIWNQHNLRKVFEPPAGARLYWGHLNDIIETTYNRDYLEPWIEHYGELDGADFRPILGYVDQRASFVRGQLPRRVEFEITTNGGSDLVTEEAEIRIEGSAWVDASAIVLSERPEQTFTFPAVTRWRTRVALAPGENVLDFFAFDTNGELLASDSITVTSDREVVFIRGDANLDGLADITDAIRILTHLFGGDPMLCLDAGDANDDELLNVTDAVVLLGFLFQGGTPPNSPFPLPGTDPSGPGGLSCEQGLGGE